ncbi:MAG: hypothetical protein H6Q86_5496, partial [candidate division NC10 bacterium]|nr:hypothetical protein [candidate division NC10 bacterium]
MAHHHRLMTVDNRPGHDMEAMMSRKEPTPTLWRSLSALLMIPIFALIGTGILPAPAALAATTTTIEVAPCEVPDEQPPRINSGDFPAGFGPDSWQGPATGKSNWHAAYIADGDKLSALFPDDAATFKISDLASISYFTKRPVGTPAGRDWWVMIYTRPTGSGDCSWYKNRFINNYNDHTNEGSWTQYSTDGGAMTFNKNACGVGGEQTLTELITNHGTELIGAISIQTDSSWPGFDGY